MTRNSLVFLFKLPSHYLKHARHLFMDSRQCRTRSSNCSSSISSPYFPSQGSKDKLGKRTTCTKRDDFCTFQDRVKRVKRDSLESELDGTPAGTGVSSTDGAPISPFACKTVLQVVDEYSDLVVVKELENKQKHGNPEPNLVSLEGLEENTEIKDTVDTNRLVFFDLETGGLSAQKADILEIAAISHDGRMFSTYVKPVKKISPFASKVNHITYKNGHVMYKGKIVTSLPLDEALNAFLGWLKIVGDGQKVVLVAHNSKFDSRFLVHYLIELGLQHCFLKTVTGFIDTIPMFKKIYPGYTSYKQEALVSKLLSQKKDYDAHSASSDVKYLKKLFDQELEGKIVEFGEFSYTSSHAVRKHLLGPKLALSVTSFKHLTTKKVMNTSIATKLAALDYRYDELVAVYRTRGRDGLKLIFTQADSKGSPRITGSEAALTKILAYFDKKYSCNKS